MFERSEKDADRKYEQVMAELKERRILYRSWRLGRYRLPGPVLSLKQAVL